MNKLNICTLIALSTLLMGSASLDSKKDEFEIVVSCEDQISGKDIHYGHYLVDPNTKSVFLKPTSIDCETDDSKIDPKISEEIDRILGF